MCHQDAVGLASYDVVRSYHFDRFKPESAARGKAAPDPLGLCTSREIWKCILDGTILIDLLS